MLTLKCFDHLVDEELVYLGEVLETWGASCDDLLGRRHPVGNLSWRTRVKLNIKLAAKLTFFGSHS